MYSILLNYWCEILIKKLESSFKKEISEEKKNKKKIKNFGRLSSVKTDLVMQITAMNIKPLMKGF